MLIPLAGVAELVDALDSGSSIRKGCASSNLALGTNKGLIILASLKKNYKILISTYLKHVKISPITTTSSIRFIF